MLIWRAACPWAPLPTLRALLGLAAASAQQRRVAGCACCTAICFAWRDSLHTVKRYNVFVALFFASRREKGRQDILFPACEATSSRGASVPPNFVSTTTLMAYAHLRVFLASSSQWLQFFGRISPPS